MNLIKIVSFLLPFGILFSPLEGSDFISIKGSAYINWTKGYVKSRAKAALEVDESGHPVDKYSGSPMGLNRGRTDAYGRAREEVLENIMRALNTMRVDSEKLFSDLIRDDAFTQRKISESLMHSLKLRDKPSGFYTSSCVGKLKLGDIIAALPYDFPSQEFPVRDDMPLSTDYSGVIIDARGLKIEPMLFPALLDPEGLEIYGRIHVDGRYACDRGIASYCYNEDEAVKNKKAGRKPYYAVAIKALNGNPVLSEKDVRKILSGKNTRNQLKRCHVIIILDRKR